MVIDGFPHVLYAVWRGDNAGPPSADEVERVVNRTREVFGSNATVRLTYYVVVRNCAAVVVLDSCGHRL